MYLRDGKAATVASLDHPVTALSGSLDATEPDEGLNRLALRDIAQ